MIKRSLCLVTLMGGLLLSVGPVALCQQPAQQQQQEQTFSGKIAQSQGKYVLQATSGTTYSLDNQDEAKKFDGQSVKVVGKLGPKGKTIHMSSIKAA